MLKDELPGLTAAEIFRLRYGDGLAAFEPPETIVWHLAQCEDCAPVLPMPFLDEGQRDRWASEHELTGHHVKRGTSTRTRLRGARHA